MLDQHVLDSLLQRFLLVLLAKIQLPIGIEVERKLGEKIVKFDKA